MSCCKFVDHKLRVLLADLKQCSSSRDVARGRRVHETVIKTGLGSNLYIANTLVSMYAKCGCMKEAHRVFAAMAQQTVVSWTSLILGYADDGQEQVALQLFCRMTREGCAPDARALVAALKACSCLASKEQGELVEGKLVKRKSRDKGAAIHSLVLDAGSNTHLACVLIDMYAKCGSMDDARRAFDGMLFHTVVSWNTLLFGYAENGESRTALELFTQMDCVPDARTFVAALKACIGMAETEQPHAALINGLSIHSLVASSLFVSELCVENTLIDMYAKCGSLRDAQRVFDRMELRDVISWNTLILGYAEHGDAAVSLKLLSEMITCCVPDALTFAYALKACATIGALEAGKALHEACRARGFLREEVLATSLVDFYCKCGSMADAQGVFDSLDTRSLIAWTALIAGYSRLGDSQRVFELLDRMRDTGLQPNRVTFLCILTACSHSGLVEQGKQHFEAMSSKFGITPGVEHYACMVDMLGRANELADAAALVSSMPFAPTAAICSSADSR